MEKMTFEYQKNEYQTEKVEQPSLDLIISAIKQMDLEKNRTFCILSKASGDFVQCSGDHQYQVVEYHEGMGNEFRHYQLERPRKGWRKWFFGHEEVLETADTIQIFTHFYQHGQVPAFFHRRDITKRIR